jgi:hypothetical protein
MSGFSQVVLLPKVIVNAFPELKIGIGKGPSTDLTDPEEVGWMSQELSSTPLPTTCPSFPYTPL